MKKLGDIDEYIRSHLDVSKLQMIRLRYSDVKGLKT